MSKLLFIVILFLTAGPSAGATTTAVTYRQIVTASQETNPVVMDVWLKGNNLRIESSAAGERFIILQRPDGVYNYIPSQNFLTKIP